MSFNTDLILIAAIFFAFPISIILLCQRVEILGKAGVVVVAFALGIAIACSVDLQLLRQWASIQRAQSTVAELSIVLALPLLLFSIDLKASMATGKGIFKSLFIAFLSITLASIAGAVIFHDSIDKVWQVSGMLVGAYTGGGPNMVAVKTAIGADQSIFLSLVTYDIFFSSIYLISMVTVGKVLLRKCLPLYQRRGQGQAVLAEGDELADETPDSYKELCVKGTYGQTLKGFLCSLLVVGASVSFAGLFPKNAQATTTIIALTTISLGLSFIPAIRQLKNSFRLGMYLVLVFCFTSGTMVDKRIFFDINLALAAYISFILIASLLMQVLASWYLKIDADTTIVTSAAAILSVPLIPVVTSALRNRDIMLPAFAAGIGGYVVGNYLGILTANITHWLLLTF